MTAKRKPKTPSYTPETAPAEILRLAKQIEGMTRKGEPAKGTFNAKLLDTCRRKKARLEELITRPDRPETFTAKWTPYAPSFQSDRAFPPSFVFNTRTTELSPEELEQMELPAFLKRDKNNRAPFMKGTRNA